MISRLIYIIYGGIRILIYKNNIGVASKFLVRMIMLFLFGLLVGSNVGYHLSLGAGIMAVAAAGFIYIVVQVRMIPIYLVTNFIRHYEDHENEKDKKIEQLKLQRMRRIKRDPSYYREKNHGRR